MLFEPVADRAEDAPQPLLPDAALDRFGERPPQRRRAFRATRAAGGWARRQPRAHARSTPRPTARRCRRRAQLWDDADVARLRPLADAVHAEGSLAGAELWHGGYNIDGSRRACRPAGRASCRPTTSRSPTLRDVDKARIRASSGLYAAAAARAEAAGLDLVYATARTRTCRRSSSRRSTTGATTTTADRCATARASGWRRSRPCARATGGGWRSRCGSASTSRARRGLGIDDVPRVRAAGRPRWSTCGTSTSARSPSRGSTCGRRGSTPRATRPRVRRRRCARRRRSRSSGSAASPIPTRWPRSSARASGTSSAAPARRSPTRSCPQDRGGPLRRHPRVHRLQRLHLARRDRRATRSLHAEPDRRRGVPPRLAPRAGAAAGGTPTATRSSSVAAWPAWSAR